MRDCRSSDRTIPVPLLTILYFPLASNMLVFVVIAVTATVTNGAILCSNTDDEVVVCPEQGYTTIPELPKGVVEV